MKLAKLLTLPAIAMALSSCSLFNEIVGGGNAYPGYEEYFTKEANYSKATAIADLNQAIKDNAYDWSVSHGKETDTYYTKNNTAFFVYKDKALIAIGDVKGGDAKFNFADESDDTPISYTSVENKYYRYKKDGTALSESDADNPNFQLSKTEGGYLAFMDRNYLYFISDDAKSFYVYEGDISAFVGPNDTKDFSDNEFAQSAAAQIKDMAYLTLPAPETDNLEIWHGWNLDSDGERSFYEAFLAGIEPSDYAELLKKNGFTVSRAGDDLKFNLFYGERGGYWMAIDPSGDLAVILRSIDYLYTAPNGKTYGPERNTDIWFKKAKQGYYSGRLLTTDTDWSDKDKETMMSWYDGNLGVVIPFFPMEDNYSVSKRLTSASEDLFGGALMLDHKCYKIYDNSLIYRLEGYGKVLEENGYRLFEPEYDIATNEGWHQFRDSDESKYYECYINQEKNVAVKYSFSIYDGNVIKVFKLDEMKSHLDDPR